MKQHDERFVITVPAACDPAEDPGHGQANASNSRRGRHELGAAAAAAVLWTAPLWCAAQTATVTTLEDVTDFGGQRRMADLPGPDGVVSFREAVTAANNTPGPQTLKFAIPQSEWWLVEDMAILKLEVAAFVLTDDETTIDFLSQRDYTGDTNPDGNEVGIYGLEANGWGNPAIIIDASRCVLHGLGMVWQRGSAVSIWDGDDNRITGFVSSSVNVEGTPGEPPVMWNVIGGTQPGEGNDLEHVSITCGADENVVIGNTLRGVTVSGSRYCVYPRGNRIGGPTPEERNVIAGFGSYGEEGYPDGVGISVSWAQDTLVEGNYIGVTADGMHRVEQIGQTGVGVADSLGTIIRSNLISGLWVRGYDHYQGQIFGQAIHLVAINGDNVGTVIEGNLIGTDATGQNPILTHSGILVAPLTSRQRSRQTRIGGPLAGQGNVIAFTDLNGVAVHVLEQGVSILGNSIRDNGRLGIDLGLSSGFDGVTANDPGDGDSGANGLQNHPVLSAATSDGGRTRVDGTLNSRGSRTYAIEFFANAACDPSGHGEGERFLGALQVTTDGAGDAMFSAELEAAVSAGQWVTSTATDATTGDTSEFSACLEVTTGGGIDCGEIRRLAARCVGGRLTAKVVSTLPAGTVLTVDNDGDRKTLTINDRGRGKVKWTGQTGAHVLMIVECPEFQQGAVCD